MPDEKAKKVPVVKRAGIPESETDVAVEAHAREAAGRCRNGRPRDDR